MGKVITQNRNPIGALYDSIGVLDRRLRALTGKHASLQVQGTLAMSDGDGAIWVDNNDHSIHYVVNGIEYKLTGTVV
jgi:hypothetical protein